MITYNDPTTLKPLRKICRVMYKDPSTFKPVRKYAKSYAVQQFENMHSHLLDNDNSPNLQSPNPNNKYINPTLVLHTTTTLLL
jgi:hypothetical protein